MSSFVVKNNAESTVADNPLGSGVTTLNVTAGQGVNFPSTFPFLITIWDETSYPDPTDDSGMEIVKCTARSTDALTIVRGQEGTGDVVHTLAERVAMLITGGIFNDATYGIATKLDGIESGATSDQTGAEIKTAYEAEANAYTDTKDTKLAGIETGATKYPDTGEQAFLDGDHTKLNGIATGADVTGNNPPQSHGAGSHTDRTRYKWLGSPHNTTGTSEFYGIGLDPTTDQSIQYSFFTPEDFVSSSNVYVYYKADSSSNDVVLDISARYHTINEALGFHQDTDMGNVIAIVATTVKRFTTSGLLTSLAPGDQGVIHVNRDADNVADDNVADLVILGVLIEYTADM